MERREYVLTEIGKREKILQKFRNELFEIEIKEDLPKLKKKYEGKYFKYKNCYSGGDPSWWLYSFCKEVKDKFTFIHDKFEVTPTDCQFQINVGGGEYLFQTQITKREYYREVNKFVKIAQKLM